MSPRTDVRVAMLALVPIALAIAAGSQAWAAGPATTRVSYLAGGSVYLEAGRQDGLAEGDTLEVTSDGRRVARLVVRYLSTGRAVCDTLGVIRMPAIGDRVLYRAHATAAPPPAASPNAGPDSTGTEVETGPVAAESTTPSVGTGGVRAGRLRGRIGARFLAVTPSDASGYTQPALELRLDGVNVGGAPIDLAVDVRGRRTLHEAAGVADGGEARVYRLAGTWHDAAGRRRLTLGRQLSTGFAAVSLFDGVTMEYAGERWGVGVFSGAEPDPATWAVNGDVLQHGVFGVRRGRNGARRWSITTGGAASFDHGQVNRQYGFLQATWLDPTLSLVLSEELDLNTGWKRAMGERVFSLTNSFVSARAQVTRRVSLNCGYDNRRAVRLYRDRATPETEFDDRHRQGMWFGGTAGLTRHLRFSTDARWSAGGAGDYHALSASAEVYRLSALQADLRWRSTRYEGATSDGWMHLVGLGARPFGQAHLELSSGTRTGTDAISQLRTRARWEGADLDLGFASRWYLLVSAQHDHGDGPDSWLWHTGLSRTF